LAKEIDRSKTEFVSLASHQLRTPLSTIGWYAEMLLAGDAGKITAEQTRYVEEIYQSNRRMAELVGSLLNVSRIELGTFSVEPEPTDLVKLAQNIVKGLEPQIFARKINFRENYGSNIPVMNVDPKLMGMVIENLASNAIKYTPEEGSVTLQLKHQAHGTQIIVADDGLGIPSGQQDKIFSKLFRADNVKTHDTEGTGLGLYLVKSVVDYSGGTIRFKSKENKGTTFYVSIPDDGMRHKRGTKELG
jgi:signal transduction histidine kinase